MASRSCLSISGGLSGGLIMRIGLFSNAFGIKIGSCFFIIKEFAVAQLERSGERVVLDDAPEDMLSPLFLLMRKSDGVTLFAGYPRRPVGRAFHERNNCEFVVA